MHFLMLSSSQCVNPMTGCVTFLPLTPPAPDAECIRPAVKMKLLVRVEGKSEVTIVMSSVPPAQGVK